MFLFFFHESSPPFCGAYEQQPLRKEIGYQYVVGCVGNMLHESVPCEYHVRGKEKCSAQGKECASLLQCTPQHEGYEK